MPELSQERQDQIGELSILLEEPGLSRGQKQGLLRTWDDLRWKCSQEDPWFFLRNLAITLDEHAPQTPYAPFPDHPYLLHMTRTWEMVAAKVRDRLLAIWKSRQVMASWFAIGMANWTVTSRPGQLCLIRTRKEDDAEKLIRRAEGMLKRLPGRVLDRLVPEFKTLSIDFPRLDSRIEGIPQGPEQVRGRTPSLLIDDELAMQEEAEAGFVAAQPAIEGGGMYVGLSSAAPGFMFRWVSDAA